MFGGQNFLTVEQAAFDFLAACLIFAAIDPI